MDGRDVVGLSVGVVARMVYNPGNGASLLETAVGGKIMLTSDDLVVADDDVDCAVSGAKNFRIVDNLYKYNKSKFSCFFLS